MLVADAEVMVYSAVEPVGRYHENRRRLHGCAYGHKSFLLGTTELCKGVPCGGPQQETLAGSLVAYEEGGGGEEVQIYLVIVRNLRTGRVIREVPTGTPATPSKSRIGVGPTTGIVLKSDGAVAWIVETGFPTTFEVHAVDKSGSRVLASGSDIDPSSLARAGNIVFWTQNSAAMSAPLY